MIVPDRPEGRQNHSIPDLLLLHHLLEAGKQIRLILKAQRDDALKAPAGAVNVRNLVAVRFRIAGRRRGGVYNFVFDSLSQGGVSYKAKQHKCSGESHRLLLDKLSRAYLNDAAARNQS